MNISIKIRVIIVILVVMGISGCTELPQNNTQPNITVVVNQTPGYRFWKLR